MAVRSFNVVEAVNPDGSEQTLLVVPEGRTLIIRSVALRVAGTGTAYVYPAYPAPSPIVVTATVGSSPLNGERTPPGWWGVMEELEALLLFGDAGLTNATVWLSGALLAGVTS